jgi:hypothetical protein
MNKMGFSTKITLGILCLMLLASTAVVFAQTSSPNPTSITSPVTTNLNAVYILSNATPPANPSLNDFDAWAVGDGGVILHWNGTQWTEQNSSTTDNLYGVIMTNATNGWAVGGSSTKGTILHYDGQNWSSWTNISYQTATSVSTSNNDTINATLYGVITDSAGSTGWIVGDKGNILIWSGSEWIGTTVGTMALRNVAMTHDTNDAWAVGDNGTIMRWNGTEWNQDSSPTNETLRSVIITNSTSGWAIGGDNDKGVILNWNTSGWTIWNNINLGGAVNSTAGYVTDSINATLYSMGMATDSAAWAVGGNGTVIYWDGIAWNGQMGITSADLKGISVSHGEDLTSMVAWAVGDGGAILAWNGTQWIPEFPTVALAPLLVGAGLFAVLLRKRKPIQTPTATT